MASLSRCAPSSRGRAGSRQPRASPLLTSTGPLEARVALCCCKALGFGVVPRAVRVHTPGQGRCELRAAAPKLAQRITRARRGLLLPRCVHALVARRSDGLARRSAVGGRDAEALRTDERVASAHATRWPSLRHLARRSVEGSKELEGRHRTSNTVGRGRQVKPGARRHGWWFAPLTSWLAVFACVFAVIAEVDLSIHPSRVSYAPGIIQRSPQRCWDCARSHPHFSLLSLSLSRELMHCTRRPVCMLAASTGPPSCARVVAPSQARPGSHMRASPFACTPPGKAASQSLASCSSDCARRAANSWRASTRG